MIPLSLRLRNFKGHKESNLDFAGLGSAILIIGIENGSSRKSNAVGKSTIFDGIKFVVFNARSSNSKNKTIRNGATKCEVEYEFAMSDGTTYKIFRHRSKTTSGVSLYVKTDSGWKDISARTAAATDQMIVQIVGLNLKTFENTFYFKQGDMFNLASATAEKRKDIISSMLELGVWKKYKELAEQEHKPIEKELDVLTAQIRDLSGDDLNTSPATVLSTLKDSLVSLCSEIKAIEGNLIVHKSNLSSNKELLTKTKSLISDQSQIERKYNDAILFKNESLDNLKFITNSIKDVNFEANKLNDRVKNHESLVSEKVKVLSALIAEAPKAVNESRYDTERNTFATNTVSLKEQQATLKNLSKSLPSDEICPTCSTVLDEKHRKELVAQKARQAEQVKKDIETTQKLISVCEENISYFESKIAEVNLYNKQRATAAADIKALNDDITLCKSNLSKLQERLVSLSEKEIKAKEAVETAANSYEEMKKLKVSAMDSSNDKTNIEINRLNKVVEVYESTVHKATQELNTKLSQRGALEERIKNKEADIKKLVEYIEKRDELAALSKMYNTVEFAFSSKGIPFMIIASVLGAIQDEANKVLKILRDNLQIQFVVDKEKDGEVQDTLDMKFFLDSDEWDFEDLSGGQQASVALALKFAMAVVNRKRCGADIRMLMLDEVDQPLDDESTDAFHAIVKEWSKDMVIMVITHRQQLKAKFNNFILVNKKNGITTASVV